MLDYASFPEQRQSLIRELLQKEGRVVCAMLSQTLQVSEHTIRRDLQELAREGVCKRVYGGAVSISPSSGNFTLRVNDNSAGKTQLGKTAAALIRSGGCIFIDSGSTNLEVAKALAPDIALTVVTGSPAIALALINHPRIEVIMLGGRLDTLSGGSLGATAQRQLAAIYFDQCVLGACALDAEAGVTVFNFQDAELKQAVVRQSNEVIIAITSEKIPAIARYRVADCSDITTLVVEQDLSLDKLAGFVGKALNIQFTDKQ
ncbi:DeoR/GlpR family DNA-binding transcription regulator [Musicola keenii]|uniref:DeoR/GlpR family DNA-binding transcription regulator n=1 Tax=Musicola keenii TaxID=2884250 RepID=UPI00177B7E65|nr:DeoR/GlpR family DNA-binding transcription regulator [Musicola keenii]